MSNAINQSSIIKEATWKDLFSNGNGIKATTLSMGVMLHATNIYLATTVMPSIVQEIGGLEYYAWNTTFFIVASVIGSVISANRMAVLGPRRAYQLAIILFALGTLICALAPAMYVLLLGRFVQGLGGGLLFALSYAMIRIVFEQPVWARAMALVSGVWGIAAFSGPLIGGIFAELGLWRWAFGSLLFFCVVIFIITVSILPQSKPSHKAPEIPYLKLLMLVLATVAVSVGSVIESMVANLGGILLAMLFIGILVWREKKDALRLLPTGAYSIRSPLGRIYAIMALLSIATAIEIYIAYFAQTIDHFSPLQSGYLTVLIAFGWTFSSIFFSGVKQQFTKRVILIGGITMFIGLTGLTIISMQPNDAGVLRLVFNGVFLFATGAGIGMGWPHLLTSVFSMAPAGEEELASASITTVQLMANTFGAALAGLVTNAGGIINPGGIEGAQQAATWLYSFFSVAPLLAIIIVLSARIKKENK